MSKLQFEYDKPAILKNGWKSWLFADIDAPELGCRFIRLFGFTVTIERNPNV